MQSGDRNIVKEAVADARRVRKLAVEAAKQKLVEEMTPSLKNLVERQIKSSLKEDVDRKRRGEEGYGENPVWEEGNDEELEGDMDMVPKMKKNGEEEYESLEAMFPGISEMGDDEEELGGDLGLGNDVEGLAAGMDYANREHGDEENSEEEYDEMAYEGIPALGEDKDKDKDKDKEEGEMDEEITIDEEGLKRAYEGIMKSAQALGEAQVSSGFADTYPGSKWETEESPPSDRGLESKEKDSAEWEKEKPPAAQDYQVKEAIEKGLKENSELRRYVNYLEEQHASAISMIKKLKGQIQEVNLFNTKVLHVNEMLNKLGKKLTAEQKKIVIEKIDGATNVREVKMVAEALNASFSALALHEGAQRRPKANAQRKLTSGAPNEKVLRESVSKSGGDQYGRMRELAGLIS